MIPTPPTTSEIMATAQQQVGHQGGGGGEGFGHLGHVADGEIVRFVGADAMTFVEESVICSMALGISSVLMAAAMIWSMLAKRTGMGVIRLPGRSERSG